MEACRAEIAESYPCRDALVRKLYRYYRTGDPFPPAVYVYGQTSTGKSTIVQRVLRCEELVCAYVNAIACYTNRILFDTIVRQLHPQDTADEGGQRVEQLERADRKLEYVKDFVAELRQHLPAERAYVIVLDNAERLRDMAHNLLPLLLQLPEATGLNISVVLVASLPYEKFYTRTGLPPVVKVFVPEYTRQEMQRILYGDYRHRAYPAAVTEEFYRNYINLFLGTFWKVCRDVKELRLVANDVFTAYCEPVLDGTIPAHDSVRLWRNVSKTLRATLSTMYMRLGAVGATAPGDGSPWLARNLELPYYAKYLLIAAYLASHNAAKEDRRLFVKNHGKQRKRLQTVNARAKVTERMSIKVGPKAFNLDRLLAIFYAILDEKVGLTCNLLAQVSTLVHLKLLAYASSSPAAAASSSSAASEGMLDGSATRLQCTVGLDFIVQIGRMVGFNVRQYLSDFF
uniref:Origin recognition complex subunit 5 n=1 Tax=Anopheles dirus TaxID=7168 RepID=A0A182N1E1_9DIPT